MSSPYCEILDIKTPTVTRIAVTNQPAPFLPRASAQTSAPLFDPTQTPLDDDLL